jgi:hypothetical protein
MLRKISARAILNRNAIAALTLAAALAGAGTAHADDKGLAVDHWSVTLKAGKPNLDPKNKFWKVQIYDAIACSTFSVTVPNGGSSSLFRIKARAHAGQSTDAKLGSHIRWLTSGIVPKPKGDGTITMWFTGQATPVGNNAAPTLAVDNLIGSTTAQALKTTCDAVYEPPRKPDDKKK